MITLLKKEALKWWVKYFDNTYNMAYNLGHHIVLIISILSAQELMLRITVNNDIFYKYEQSLLLQMLFTMLFDCDLILMLIRQYHGEG